MKQTLIAISIAALFSSPVWATGNSNNSTNNNNTNIGSASASNSTAVAGAAAGAISGSLSGSISSGGNSTSSSAGGTSHSSSSGGHVGNVSTGDNSVTNTVEAADLKDRVPDLHVGGLTTGDCMGSASGSVVAAGFGLGGGKTVIDEDCNARRNAIMLYNMGQLTVAIEVLCDVEDIREADARAETGLCLANQSVVLETGTTGARQVASARHTSSRR